MANVVYKNKDKYKTVDAALTGNGFEIEGKTYLKLAGYDLSEDRPRVMGVNVDTNVLVYFAKETWCTERGDITITVER